MVNHSYNDINVHKRLEKVDDVPCWPNEVQLCRDPGDQKEAVL